MMHSNDFLETRPSLLAALHDGATGVGDLAWREFFELYGPPVLRVARKRGLSEVDAEDVVQQVMLAVFGHIGGFRYERDRCKFRTWVLRIAENKIIDYFRKRVPSLQATERLDRREAGGADVNGPDGLWETEWRAQDLMYCLNQIAVDIAPRRMLAFQLYVLQGVPAEETAKQLGMTTAYVYVTRNQVLKMLEERLAKLEERRQ